MKILFSRKKAVVLSILFVFLISMFCALFYRYNYTVKGTPMGNKVIFAGEDPFPLKEFTYNGNRYLYTVSGRVAGASKIDRQIGLVGYMGDTQWAGGRWFLYSLKNVRNLNEIALKTKYGYELAYKTHQRVKI